MNLRVVKRRDGLEAGTASPDEGFSLVEVVMTLVLMGLVLLPLMNAAITGVKASSSSRRVAELQTVLNNAADRVNRASVHCSYLVYVEAAAQTKGWAPTQAAATYEYYVPGATAAVDGTWHAYTEDDCTNGSVTLPAQNVVQRVTITMTSPEANISRTLQVVKSDV